MKLAAPLIVVATTNSILITEGTSMVAEHFLRRREERGREAGRAEGQKTNQELWEAWNRSLNWRSTGRSDHAVRERLETIAALPPTPAGGPTNWKQWWLEQRESRVGIRRRQDHYPGQDPVSEILNQTIRAMARAAALEMPRHDEIAQYLLDNPPGREQTSRKPRSRLPGRAQRLNLSDVWIAGQ